MRQNTGLLLAARVASAVTTLIVLSLISRVLGADALGVVGIGLAAGSIGAAFADAGMSSLTIREVARQPEDAGAFLGAGLMVRFVTVPIVLALTFAAALLITPGSAVVVTLVAAGAIAQLTAELTRAVFIARQRMAISSLHAIAENAVWLLVIATALLSGAPLEAIFAAALAVWIASVLAGLLLLRVLASVRPRRPPRHHLRQIVMAARPFTGFAVVGIAYSRIDPLLIGLLASGAALTDAGAYFAASRLLAAFEFLPDALSRAVYPELSRRVRYGGDVAQILRSSAGALLLVGLAVPTLLIPAGAWLMGALFGPETSSAAWILGALSLAVPVRFLGYLYGVTLTSSDAQGRRLAAASSALVLVVIVDVVGIPIVGLVAPVLSAVGAATIVFAIYARFVRDRFGTTGLNLRLALALVAAAACSVVLGLLVRALAGDVVGALVAALAYLALAALSPARPMLRHMVQRRAVP
jgi:O-antigen/teichoic acid export membrane protein